MALRKKARKTRTGIGRTGAAAKRKAAPGRTAKAATPRGQAGVIVKDSQRASPQGARKVGDVDRAEMMEVTVTLRGPKLPTADELGARTFSTKSFSARFGASPRDVDKVSQVLRELGLKIVGVSPYTRSMRVSGSIAAMEAVFHPDLAMYKTKDQPSFRDREGTYKVPASLHGIITAVLGFGERRVAQRKPARVKKKVAHPNSPFTPADIESHYHFPPGDAAGQTIAIAEFGGGYFTSDLTDYCRKFNRPVPKVKTVSIDKVPIRNRAQIARLPVNAKSELDNTGEVMMDVQIVAGLCPAAKLSVYFAKDSQKGWVDLLDQVIREKPAALSISWGAAEDSSGWSKAARNALNDRLNVAAALGITVACAAGDDGSGDMQNTKGAHVDFPSSSPFVLAVGGTMITRKDKKFTEQVWRVGKGRRVNGRGGATGGGVSMLYERPKWQDVSIKSVNKKSIDGRVVPDITALAGPPMYDLVFDGDDDFGGGTSASAPVLAALIARIYALLPKKKRRRFLTPLLYRKSPQGTPMGHLVCRDITIGHNTSIPFPGRGYKATKGFDAVSGWGTPIGKSLLLALT